MALPQAGARFRAGERARRPEASCPVAAAAVRRTPRPAAPGGPQPRGCARTSAIPNPHRRNAPSASPSGRSSGAKRYTEPSSHSSDRTACSVAIVRGSSAGRAPRTGGSSSAASVPAGVGLRCQPPPWSMQRRAVSASKVSARPDNSAARRPPRCRAKARRPATQAGREREHQSSAGSRTPASGSSRRRVIRSRQKSAARSVSVVRWSWRAAVANSCRGSPSAGHWWPRAPRRSRTPTCWHLPPRSPPRTLRQLEWTNATLEILSPQVLAS